MARPKSIFQRNFTTLAWVAFALLAVLPILALLRIGLLLPELGKTSAGIIELTALGISAVVCLSCGFFLLRWFGTTLRKVSETSEVLTRIAPGLLPAELPPGAKVDEVRIHNELVSLTQSLSRIQTEFTRNMEKAHTQAAFLENLQRVINFSSDMILILDSANRITFSNQAAREKLGLLPDNSIRHSLAEGLLNQTDAAKLADLLETWEPADKDLSCARSGGTAVHLHCILTVVEGAGDTPRNKIVILRDLTDRKRMERQLYRSEQLAALGQLISGVAHELNNPLAAVLGFSELCRDPRISPEDLKHNLEVIEREAGRTARIVENLLNFSRQRSAKRAPVDVNELLDRCFSLLSYNFRTNNIAVQRRYAEPLPRMELDEYQIQQVLMNIIINAMQAMRDARILHPQVTASTQISPDGGHLIVEISDNGPGIPTSVVEHIFDPFFTTKGDDQGTGLGLTVSQGIIEGHGGTLAVRTSVGQGTTFVIYLPMVISTQPPAGKLTVAEQAASGNLGSVLVVDDEPAILEMTLLALKKQDWDPAGANSLAEAQELLRRREFDVVVCDVCMPDGDGITLLEYSRKNFPATAARFLFVTGDPQTAMRLRNQGGNPPPVLLKPFHVSELCGAVRRLALPHHPAQTAW